MTNDDFSDLPDYETYLSDLEKLSNYNFEGLKKSEIYNICYDFARTMPSRYGTLSPEKFNHHTFYRARINIDKEKEDLGLIQTYSYPSSIICNKNGRANVKGTSVFYCSDNPNAAILEVKPKIGDEIFLSVWKGVTTKNIKVGICLPKDLPKENNWRDLALDSFNVTNRMLLEKSGDKSRHLLAVCNYFANKFSTEKEPYYISSMISWEMLHGQLWQDFIIYPTTQANNVFSNMAFHPNSVNMNLMFERIIILKIIDIGNENIKYDLGVNVGILENTKIVWKPRTENDEKLFKKE